ncbi:MAG TPA: flagellar export protein FliJ [Ramlibacter sp.]|jgi:flagellar FliJ protein|uniref:flagellar export protein FliJ n=1 Tax=Ramlibacter sp. TaxID=1917967 RepID=UPI002D53F9E5|nr:flagellar export protein FliJ [Ramlibacter sp.]HZY19159.1 flagellar export protein FliJ [Ramlibacter sp.]
MQHVLPLLIEQAQAARDQQSVRLKQAQQAVQQAQATLQRLLEFRAECLSRSPAATLGRGDGGQLADYQRFVSRLDEAIAMQRREAQAREGVVGQQQQLLVQCQQRMLAFETLSRRQAQQRDRREQRRGQREADEFAARAVARQENPQP